VRSGRFREDLYYRLNVFPIELPPLRERPLDILPLAQEVIARFAAGREIGLSPAAERSLTTHRWAGNIRELENVLQRALILAHGTVVEPGDLHLPAATAAGVAAGRQELPLSSPLPSPADSLPLPAAVVDAAGQGGSGPAVASTETLDIKSLERRHILEALALAGGSRRKAASRLQMSERTLRYKLAQYRAAGWLDGAMQDDDDGSGA
jgi:two-component system response regulator FlrC